MKYPAILNYLSNDGLFEAFLFETFLREERWNLYRDRWYSDVRHIADLPGYSILREEYDRGQKGLLIESDGLQAYVTLQHSMISATIIAVDQQHADAFIAALKQIAPQTSKQDEHNVPVYFWVGSDRNPYCMQRYIEVPTWEEIRQNYPEITAEQLHILMQCQQPQFRGQLILWYGLPGTGKTFALRSLIRSWKSWCVAHYITDPDVFLGYRSDYLMRVLLQDREDPAPSDGDSEETAATWRLLIMEDSGEFLASDAKTRQGQGLSRLLNVVDGLVGQGLRIMVLITANDELGTMHPAVVRPGRCAMKVEFTPFSESQALAWLKRHDVPTPERGLGKLTLAELYSLKTGGQIETSRISVGFTPKAR